jgi:hypothetical protein
MRDEIQRRERDDTDIYLYFPSVLDSERMTLSEVCGPLLPMS